MFDWLLAANSSFIANDSIEFDQGRIRAEVAALVLSIFSNVEREYRLATKNEWRMLWFLNPGVKLFFIKSCG